MKHQPKKFYLSGIILDDSVLVSERAKAETWLLREMRDEGFVPMLAQEPIWVTLKRKDHTYRFELSVYAVYVGKDKAWVTEGMESDGRMLPRIPQPRLSLF